ncbi:hypothetical protein G7085_17970 [Tessaracoccus sp. HDW20]|uniref:LssY C-terminal domain-containing protein n=1 Tax=Tessaracoccus coleopterorum TaxID=2714950 RepID=UPI0018D2A2B6|nr:LssY C-terminal domain-containing protein [Tessaracoccus coleopterorum]NHB85816.1 hypothetical protein [Tessaracoccus coleopterorum]
MVDTIFIVLALIFSGWLAGRLLLASFHLSPLSILPVIGFYAVVAYLLLPRMHQVFTDLYVPNYFIGRTRTGDGLLGDPINLALDGSEADVHAAMQRAGWTLADEVTIASSMRIIASTLLRRTYKEAPVSDLMLFGRRQDFAYQQEVGGDASKRHHVRFWKAPDGWLLPGGEKVDWLAAGTYDRRVGLSLFTMQVTHKIDPDTDAERDYIIATLEHADPEIYIRVIHDFSTAYHARNGGGDAIRTDGDLPIADVGGAVGRSHRRELPIRAEEASITEHHIPPVGLLFAGLLVLLRSIQMGFIVPEVMRMADVLGATEGQTVLAAVAFGSVAVVYLALWLLTLARRSWARTLFMLMLSLDAFLSLSQVLPVGGGARLLVLAGAALSVLTLLAVTGPDASAWVRERRGRGRPVRE